MTVARYNLTNLDAHIEGAEVQPTEAGMIFTNANGKFLFEGLFSNQEYVFVEALGWINVTKAWSLVPEDARPKTLPINDNIENHIVFRFVDEDVIAKMSPKRRREPLLFISDGKAAHLVDGVHRLTDRIRRGRRDFACFELIPDAAEYCRIIVWKLTEDGGRERYVGDPTV